MEKVTGRFSFLVIASACLLIAGCHAPIDVDLAYDSIKDADGRLVDNGIEILTEKFGEPHAPSAGQLRKMENQEKSYRGSRGKTDFSNFKVWGNDSKFIAMAPPGNGNRVVVFGQKPRPMESPSKRKSKQKEPRRSSDN